MSWTAATSRIWIEHRQPSSLGLIVDKKKPNSQYKQNSEMALQGMSSERVALGRTVPALTRIIIIMIIIFTIIVIIIITMIAMMVIIISGDNNSNDDNNNGNRTFEAKW